MDASLLAEVKPFSLPPAALCEALGVDQLSIEALTGDASDRQYYRLKAHQQNHSWVLMQLKGNDRLALEEERYDWIPLRAKLAAEGLAVPELIACLPHWGCLLIEDCGDMTLAGAITPLYEQGNLKAIVALYRQTFALLGRLLKISPQPQELWCQRRFDQAKLLQELNFFKEHLIAKLPSLPWTTDDEQQFSRDAQQLTSYLAARPSYFVHRDFHSRNLLLKNAELPILIDFQDARLGPAAYDLVSLCFDAYVPLNYRQRHQLLNEGLDYMAQLVSPLLAHEASASWKAMLLQRQLKALGSFGYLTTVKGQKRYWQYLQPAIASLREVADRRWPFLSSSFIEKLGRAIEAEPLPLC